MRAKLAWLRPSVQRPARGPQKVSVRRIRLWQSLQLTSTAQKRANSLQSAAADTDLDENLEEAEEELGKEEEEGVAFEPFNLAQERREGHFDEGGHWVEDKADDEDLKDAWLGSASELLPSITVANGHLNMAPHALKQYDQADMLTRITSICSCC